MSRSEEIQKESSSNCLDVEDAGSDDVDPISPEEAESRPEDGDNRRMKTVTNSALALGKQSTDAAIAGSRRVTKVAGLAGAAATRAASAGTKSAATATASAAQAIGSGTTKAGVAGGRAVSKSARWVFDTTSAATAQVFISAQALVASDLSSAINAVVAAAVKGAPTVYDKAMDAQFLETYLGGNFHRHFDGGHTIWGAFKAAHNASPDDTLIQETLGAIVGLLRDAHTPRGLPLATWDKATFDAVADSLSSNFGISKSSLYDLNSYDAADVLGGTVGAVSVIFGWNRADTETFSQIAASMALSAALSTNPLLMPIAVVALGRAFHKAQSADQYGDLADGAFKGALVSGTSLGAIALVGVAGGPAGVAMLTGITAGVLAQTAAKNVELDAVCRFVKDEARTVMGQIAAQAVTVGDGSANFAARAGSAVAQGATTAADAVGKQASQAGRAVAAGAASAGSATAGTAAAAGRATADAARAAGRVGAAATTAAHSAVESVARRAKALVDRNEPEDPEVDQPDVFDD